MSLNHFFRRSLRRLADWLSPLASELHGPRDLQQAIRRERSRADRTGGQFSVLSLFAQHSPGDRRPLLPLVDHLKRRSRSTDDLGWNRDNQLCIVLPECSAGSAANLGEELCDKFSPSDSQLVYTLYHYASAQPPQQSPENNSRSADSKPGSPTQDVFDSLEQALELTGAIGCYSMDDLFLRPMPWWKRTLDIVGATAGLIVLSPLMAVVALAVKCSSPGPVLFRQLRSGRGGLPFTLLKFRSMVEDAEQRKSALLRLNEQDGPAFKIEKDPRITRVGRFLRASSLDELPQLWNVLRGDMSLVGPRPLPVNESNACAMWQRQRLDVTPGLTCFWQVKDRRATIPFVDWARMDIRYVRKPSLLTDLRLIAQTVMFVIRRKGV